MTTCRLVIDTSNGAQHLLLSAVALSYSQQGSQGSVTKLYQQLMQMKNQYEEAWQSLSSIAVVVGPGSLSGVRVGVGMATALAYAKKIKILAMPALMAVAYVAAKRYGLDRVVVCRNARLGQHYLGGYVIAKNSVSVLEERVISADQWKPQDECVYYAENEVSSDLPGCLSMPSVTPEEYGQAAEWMMGFIPLQKPLLVKPIYWRSAVVSTKR